MQFIYRQEGDPGPIANRNQDRGYFGPTLLATCEDFELDATLQTLAEQHNTSGTTFLVHELDEYKVSTPEIEKIN